MPPAAAVLAGTAAETSPRSARFQRTQRLLRPKEFDRVFKHGRRHGGRLLSVLAAPGDTGQSRIGFAIARKAVPDAVQRNLIKRKLREHFRLHEAELAVLDLVFMARPTAAEATREQVQEAIQACWQQLKKQSAPR